MEELLQKLLEAQVLTEDTKKELEEALKTRLDETVSKAREEAKVEVHAQLREEWISEREALIEALETKVDDSLKAEIAELREDIERFRDLEAEYAQKIVEAKASMASTLKNDLAELVEKLDTFLEIRLAQEIEELREDIDEVRKNDFGRRVFEAFQNEFRSGFADEQSAQESLRDLEQALVAKTAALEEAENKAAKLERHMKLERVLAPLSGRQREVMEAILRSVETKRLEEAYKTFIGRVLRESTTEVKTETTTEKETPVLAEGEDNSVKTDKLKEGVVVTGDTETVITESDKQATAEKNDELSRLKALAGVR